MEVRSANELSEKNYTRLFTTSSSSRQSKTSVCNVCAWSTLKIYVVVLLLLYFFFFFSFLPLLDFVVCPSGPLPPLLLARRPNRGHIGGGGWTPSCGSCLRYFYRERVQHFHPRQPWGQCTKALFTNEIRRNRVQFFQERSEKKTQFAGTRTHDLKLRRFTRIPTRGMYGAVVL